MANRIYRGRVDCNKGHPRVGEVTATGAALPGYLVTRAGAAASALSTVFGQEVLIAKEVGQDVPEGGINDAFAIGDFLPYYITEPGELYMVRVVTGQNLSVGTPLTTAANGQFTIAATDGTVEIMFHAEEAVNTSANDTLVLARRA